MFDFSIICLFQKSYPKKLKIVTDTKPITVASTLTTPQLIVQKFDIPHKGDITIMKDGSIEICQVEEFVEPTVIPKSDGIMCDYRELDNGRIGKVEQIQGIAMEKGPAIAGSVLKATIL